MNSRFFWVPLLVFAGFVRKPEAQPLHAQISIDLDRYTGSIDSLIYGNFTEHLGRCIYGGIYDPGSPQSDRFGFRKDVEQAVKDLHVSIIRWPGGNFSSDYHWMDGIGPVAERPKRRDLAWGGIEPNLVGTDEFLQWAARSGVQPYICVNMGTGTLDEAKYWVEYCNGAPGTYYADLRVKNGHPEPYHVRIWGLGNEIDGQWQMGHKDAADYGKFALEAAKLMKWQDTSIRLVASGSSNWGADWMGWNRTVLEYLYPYVDYLSLHYYTGKTGKDHYQFMSSIDDLDRKIKITAGLIQETRMKYHVMHPIYIALDEYNVWYRAFNAQHLEEHYNLEDALVIAEYLNCIIRNAAVVKMANMAQLVNVIAPMMITGDSLWKQTIFFPFQLFATYCHGRSIDAELEAPDHLLPDGKNLPLLDISAVRDDGTHTVALNVVNRSADSSIQTQIRWFGAVLGGPGTAYTVNGKELSDENSLRSRKVGIHTDPVAFSGNSLTYTFPAHSFTMIRIPLVGK
ncbi:MAG TPA: alpha-L-arabinofuranosidase C-terminal domain-containing protein [Chitinophagaceae bacterium]|nr:alpha-L-arabinofuranosidase C-terminal domain-containing protein [Chitinophagaceae bacterium]